MSTRKRLRPNGGSDTASKTYHEGPLDEIFGQHRVFPGVGSHEDTDPAEEVDKYATLQVNNYLHQVRQEAENDRCVHYATRNRSESAQEQEEDQDQEQLQEQLQEQEQDQPQSQLQSEAPGALQEHQLIDPVWSSSTIQQFLQLKERIKAQIDSEAHLPVSNLPDVPQSASAWRTLVFQQDPPPVHFFFRSLDHPTIIKLIVYFTKWISMTTPESVSKWIFTVFLRLDHPLEYTECSIVRDLGKKARKLLDKMNIEDVHHDSRSSSIKAVSRYTIEMVLVIVSTYYGQKDLLFV